MKEHPILFSGEMVRAILEGRKTMTRRVIPEKIVDAYYEYDSYCRAVMPHDVPCSRDYEKSFFMQRARWEPGDRLWVREAWYYEEHMHDTTDGEPDLPDGRYSHRFVYRADAPNYPVNVGVGRHGWIPSIHMPRTASRITLEVTGVRVERLQAISEADCIAEGCPPEYLLGQNWFKWLWDSINSKRPGCSWEDNPWVWVIEFKRVTQ